MTTLQYVHFSIELWGAFFCMIAITTVFIQREFDKSASYKLIALLTSSFFLMVSDAMAWLFRGNPSEAGYYIVRIANFAAFFFGFLTMPLVAEYITHIIKKRRGIEGLYWKYIEWALFIIGTVLLTVNIFHEFIYTFDAENTYYRLPFGVLPGVIAFVGIVITFGVALENLRYLYPSEKVATIIFLVLPFVAVVMQSFHYGISFTNLSLVLSAMTLFISYEVNNVRYYAEKEKRLSEERICLFNQQIQPHYIFNSLAVIKHLCRKDPDEACHAIDEFSGYLRESTDFMNGADLVPIEREIELVNHYLYMQQKQYGDQITFECDAEDTDYTIPPFTIQVAVENALKHGLRSQVMQGGLLRVKTYLEGNYHIITIEDNGVGFDTDILKNDFQTEHVGIKNTKERLRLLCGGTMNIKSEIKKGTKVTISIPKEKKQ